jgi:hypothetical protein
MNFYLKKTWASKLLLTIATSIILVFIINQAEAMRVLSIYYDKKTGLEWSAGPDEPTNWYDAKSWVDSLGGGWRMPTMKELKTLYQKGEQCNIKHLVKTTGCWVWSGETKGSSLALGYDFSGGRSKSRATLKRDESTDSTRGFAVRSRK